MSNLRLNTHSTYACSHVLSGINRNELTFDDLPLHQDCINVLVIIIQYEVRARRLRNEQRLKKDKLEVLLSKDYTWQMEKRKQEQIKVSSIYDTVHVRLLSKKLMTSKHI